MRCETISIDEVAQRLGICRPSAYQAARNGEIPGAFKIGRRWLVRRKVFEKFLDLPPPEIELGKASAI